MVYLWKQLWKHENITEMRINFGDWDRDTYTAMYKIDNQ